MGKNKKLKQFLNTADYNDESKFYIAQIKKDSEDPLSFKDYYITDIFSFVHFKPMLEEFYVKIPIIETNGVKREFLTNIPVDLDCVKEDLIKNKQFSEILDKDCLFFHSFVRVTKEDFAKVLLDIKKTDAIEDYCEKLYDKREDDMKMIMYYNKKQEDKAIYKETSFDADEVIKSFVKQK